jgi:hypothetical protein
MTTTKRKPKRPRPDLKPLTATLDRLADLIAEQRERLEAERKENGQ